MARNGTIQSASQYAPYLKLEWEIVSQNRDKLTTTIQWQLYYSNIQGSFISTQAVEYSVTIDGKTQVGTWERPSGSYDGSWLKIGENTTTIKHNPNGLKTAACYAEYQEEGNAVHTFANGTITPDGLAPPVSILSAPNFTDEESPTIKYEAFPVPELIQAVDVGIYTTSETAPEVAYRSISNSGSAQIVLSSTDKAALYAKMDSYTRILVRYVIRTTFIDGSASYRTKTAYFSLVNHEPTLSPTVKDTNSRTVALTGNNQKFIKYFSNAQITVGATGRKGADIEYRTIQNGAQFLDDYTSDTATLNAIESNTFYLSATDTRGSTTNGFKTVDLIPYVKFTCALETEPLTASGSLTFTISGKYYKGSFGAKSNELEVEYMITNSAGKAIAASESGWVRLGIVSPTVSGTDYTYSYTITGLNHEEQYELTVNAFDVLTPIQTVATIVQAVPVFDWGKSDFHHHTDVILSHNKVIRGTTPEGDVIEAINPCNQNGALAVGWGGYSNEYGRTDLMGNKVYISAKDGIELGGGDAGITIKNQPLADFVIEQGASGVWNYRKWNSGRVDVYGYENISNIPCTNALGGWYRTAVIQPPAYPFTITSPNVVVSYESSGYGALVWQTTEATSARPPDYYLIRPTSATIVSGKMRWQISGRWK